MVAYIASKNNALSSEVVVVKYKVLNHPIPYLLMLMQFSIAWLDAVRLQLTTGTISKKYHKYSLII